MTGPATSVRVAAVDLGATSGRIMAGRVGTDVLELQDVHRFPNSGVPVRDSLYWDVLGIHREVLAGLRAVARSGPLDGIGIDSWALDYGLLDERGELLGNPYSHRDRRTDGIVNLVTRTVPAGDLYAVSGLQQLAFNTIFQLVAARGTAAFESAETLLLLPDLLGYWLTGRVGAERTNASTTGLLDITTGSWSRDLAKRLDLPLPILPPLREPGEVVGPLLPKVAADLGLDQTVPVIGVASHDTASAVVGIPAEGDRFAYISSGTWSLVGLELSTPVLTEEARLADFTNEGGVDGTIRFLKNVGGLWVLSECIRAWADEGVPGTSLASLLPDAGAAPPLRTVVDINAPVLLPPSSVTDPMPQRIIDLARRAGEPVPRAPGDITRCLLDSLAVAYRRHLRTAARLADHSFDVVHVVGGGSQNHLLCQLTADACGVPVLAGPTEAAALGNVLVQARTIGADVPDLSAMRALLRRTQDVRRYEPRLGLAWEAAEGRVPATRDGATA